MNVRQIASVIFVLVMGAAIFTLFSRQKTDPDATDLAQLDTDIGEVDIAAKLAGDRSAEPLDLAELEVEDVIDEDIIVEPDVIMEDQVIVEKSEPEDIVVASVAPVAPVATAPAACTYPGDGFTPSIRGSDPADFIPFDYPRAKGDAEMAMQPVLVTDGVPEPETACVVLTYDISATGQVINIAVYDIQPASAAGEEYYQKTAVVAAREQSFHPGARNGKAVQIDNNVMEIRFAQIK
ncbi:MAG: hypothetical protein V3V30_03245 [Parvularculaceae bacterium]